jgi:prepilin-type N-terminal cleavage/methylation domain-containing protein
MNVRDAERPDGRNGFTLVELLISTAVGLVLLTAGYGVFTIQNKRYSIEEQIVEMQQNARAVTDIMAREIRMAGYDFNDDNASKIITATTSPPVFSFGTDKPKNNSKITYGFNSKKYRITRDINGSGAQPLAENI